jgi:hypothetical protein
VLEVWFDSPSPFRVLLGRSRRRSGDSFGAHRVVQGPQGKDQYLDSRHLKPTGPKGKLRLERTGKLLHFLVAEGQNVRKIQSLEIGTPDVKTIQVHCQTMYEPIALELRLTELVVEADQFPDGTASAQPPAPPTFAEASQMPERKRWWALIALAVLTVLLAGAMGVWLYARQRGNGRPVGHPSPKGEHPEPKAAPAAVTVQCPQCNRRSKARAELAGKKVKCPQCGTVLAVPE